VSEIVWSGEGPALSARLVELVLAAGERPVVLAHLGCKHLKHVKGAPAALKKRWDAAAPGWRRAPEGGSAGAVGAALAAGVLAARRERPEVGGVEVVDTMRLGSDYWRPGRLLSQAAEAAGVAVTFWRDDDLCPPRPLLERFRAGGELSFGEFAEAYARHLGAERVERAAFAVLRALAQGQVAAFACADPYLPDYGRSADFLSGRPWPERAFEPELRLGGCHRVVLAEAVARFFQARGVGGVVLEIDPTGRRAHRRAFGPGGGRGEA